MNQEENRKGFDIVCCKCGKKVHYNVESGYHATTSGDNVNVFCTTDETVEITCACGNEIEFY